jgi:GT2 family glycosyltransferase
LLAGAAPPAFGYDADIIILTQSRVRETIAAVDSALAQQNLSYHVSVLDQGSSEAERADLVTAFSGREGLGFWIAQGNLGVAGGRNFLSSLGRGEVIIGLDNDAEFADALVAARAVAQFQQTPELGVIGFRIMARDGISLDRFSWGYPRPLMARAGDRFVSTTFVGAGHAIRRRTWVEAGGYDADLFFTWEEYDFSLRAIALRWTIVYDGALAVIHKVSPEARVRWRSARMRYFVRNRLMIARKWNTGWLALLPRMAGYLVKGARNGSPIPALAGALEAITSDHLLFKREPSAQMRGYLREHEHRHRETFLRSLYLNAVLRMQADPE